ncbi:hypothetical protein SETIT_3G369600v2 [Setaria italica]|uniref:Uncharacterized protein n=1 Tax=Setaria italica TaxID=4555 RepID=A0A368QMX0_SETIT|nr:hypothetical protein SETIT_3G369600v2 [Setaria italica]
MPMRHDHIGVHPVYVKLWASVNQTFTIVRSSLHGPVIRPLCQRGGSIGVLKCYYRPRSLFHPLDTTIHDSPLSRKSPDQLMKDAQLLNIKLTHTLSY